MAAPLSQIRIVVSSPNDVAAERAALERAVDEINQTVAVQLGVQITLSRWETAAGPGFAKRGPQQFIDEILDIPNCDIFLGIFWKRFGTPVDDAASGTEHEFKQAYEAWQRRQRPEIMFYFSGYPYSPKDKKELEQWGRVLDFKENFPKEGLWWPYDGPGEFESLVRGHLLQRVVRLVRSPAAPVTRVPTADTISRRSIFVGRAAELARLEAHIEESASALIILEGIAGIGKSSLARKFLSNLNARSYRTFWHACQTETTVDSFTWALARWSRAFNPELSAALDELPNEEHERVAYLTTALSRHTFVLVLDDYHLVRDAMLDAVLAELADLTSMAKVILISRRRPNILLRVSRGAAIEEHLSNGLEETACAEFLQATHIHVDRQTVARIRELTGNGHPKALQLFANRAQRIPVPQLLSTLPVFRLDLIREWLRPLLDELPEDERAAMLDLSIFDRPLPFADVRRLRAEGDSEVVIASLLERFLVDPAADGMFQVHPLVREYCATLIVDPQTKHQWAGDYYREKAGALDDPDFANDLQIEALLAAWSHYIKAENQAAATEVVDTLRPPLMNRGHYEQMLQLVQDTSPPDAADADFFKIHIGRVRSLKGDAAGAEGLLAPITTAEDVRTRREAVLVLSSVYSEHGRAAEAWRLLESNRGLFGGGVSSRIKLRFLSRVVQAFLELRDYEKALEWARHLTDVSEAAGDKISGAIGLRQMGASFLSQGKTDTALELTRISLELFGSAGRTREAAHTKLQLARVYAAQGEKEQGRAMIDEAMEAFTSIGDRIGIAQARQLSRQVGAPAETASA